MYFKHELSLSANAPSATLTTENCELHFAENGIASSTEHHLHFIKDERLSLAPNALPQRPSQKRTTFLDLPAELRNEIYRLFIISEKHIPIRFRTPSILEPALSLANKQVRSESLSIFYGETTFWTTHTFTLDNCFSQLDSLKLSLLGSVQVATLPMPSPVVLLKHILERYAEKGLKEDVVKVWWGYQWRSWSEVKDEKEAKWIYEEPVVAGRDFGELFD